MAVDRASRPRSSTTTSRPARPSSSRRLSTPTSSRATCASARARARWRATRSSSPRSWTSSCPTPAARAGLDPLLELWLRAARHPDMRPTAARLYARMREWVADAIAAGIEGGEFRAGRTRSGPPTCMALGDGYGVRVLIGDLDIETLAARPGPAWRASSTCPRRRRRRWPARRPRVARFSDSGSRFTSGGRRSREHESASAARPDSPSGDPVGCRLVIRERGLESARIADIAAAAGTSPPAVLYWFASKAELLEGGAHRGGGGLYDELERELAASRAPASGCAHHRVGPGQGDYGASLWMELWARALRDPDWRPRAPSSTTAGARLSRSRPLRAGAGRVRPGRPGGVRGAAGIALDGLSVQVALARRRGHTETCAGDGAEAC